MIKKYIFYVEYDILVYYGRVANVVLFFSKKVERINFNENV